MTTYTVSSATDLQAVLSGASGGDVIELAAGVGAEKRRAGLEVDNAAERVLIARADAGDEGVAAFFEYLLQKN